MILPWLFKIFIILVSVYCIMLIHEIGHIIAAKIIGVQIDKIIFGYPIKGWKSLRIKIGMTDIIFYPTFFLITLVILPDHNAKSKLPNDSPKRMANKPLYKKIFYNLAGVIINFFFPICIFFIMGIFLKEMPAYDFNMFIKTNSDQIYKIEKINNNDVNQILALKKYLRIYQKNEEQINIREKSLKNAENNKVPIAVVNFKPNENIKLSVIDIQTNRQLELNIKSTEINNIQITENKNNINSISQLIRNTFKCYIEQINVICFYIKELFTGQINLYDLRGLISYIKISLDFLSLHEYINFLWLAALLSVSMVITNLIPYPGMDGGIILFLILENRINKEKLIKILTFLLKRLFLFIMSLQIIFLCADIIALIQKKI